MKKIMLRFRAGNRDIFDAIKSGKKKVETRAATKRYADIVAGDMLVFVCGKHKFEKRVKRVKIFRSVAALVRAYRPKDIHPRYSSAEELLTMYDSFPNYKKKIKSCGLIAMELK